MTRKEFIGLIGHDLVVDYPFGGELQRWSMKNFSYDMETDTLTHNRLALDMEVFVANAQNPHSGKATHG